MSGNNTADQLSEKRASVLDHGDNTQAGQVRAAISTAALGLLSAGIHEGEMKVSPSQAIEAAAAVFQMVHDAMNMRLMMYTVARRHDVRDAYGQMVARDKK